MTGVNPSTQFQRFKTDMNRLLTLTSSLLLFSPVALSAPRIFYAGENGRQMQVGEINRMLVLGKDTILFEDAPAEEAWLREKLRVRDAQEIMRTIPDPEMDLLFNRVTGPWVFSGYRHVVPRKMTPEPYRLNNRDWVYPEQNDTIDRIDTIDTISDGFKTLKTLPGILKPVYSENGDSTISGPATPAVAETRMSILGDVTPDWLRKQIQQEMLMDNFMYNYMIQNPSTIDYAYWDLPVPPRLPEDDVTFESYIRKLDLPEIDTDRALLPEYRVKHRHWLHTTNAALQFSQAYVSSNWYQGGNDYLAILFNGLWDVQLNKVFHPDLLFQSTLSYKLGLNSTPQDEYHSYSISEDLFQYNLKAGLKAFSNWFYSYNMQFKTQFFNNYPANSKSRNASFLSPADLNMGLGMTYSYANKYRTFTLNLSVSPISYNLKTCIDSEIDPTRFNIEPGHKSHSEIGSNLECNIGWQIISNVSCKARLFAFTDYKYFQSDLETTFNFDINKFLSTQLYLHLRYDSSSDEQLSRWKHWMFKEILSFGLSYTFSTKP